VMWSRSEGTPERAAKLRAGVGAVTCFVTAESFMDPAGEGAEGFRNSDECDTLREGSRTAGRRRGDARARTARDCAGGSGPALPEHRDDQPGGDVEPEEDRRGGNEGPVGLG
jgi:hypothetical protein